MLIKLPLRGISKRRVSIFLNNRFSSENGKLLFCIIQDFPEHFRICRQNKNEFMSYSYKILWKNKGCWKNVNDSLIGDIVNYYGYELL